MKKLIIEIPLTKHIRADELGPHAQALLYVVRKALSTVTVPRGAFHDLVRMSIHAESEPVRPPARR